MKDLASISVGELHGVGRVRAYAYKQGTKNILAEYTSAQFDLER